jgi:hypothetical protein
MNPYRYVHDLGASRSPPRRWTRAVCRAAWATLPRIAAAAVLGGVLVAASRWSEQSLPAPIAPFASEGATATVAEAVPVTTGIQEREPGANTKPTAPMGAKAARASVGRLARHAVEAMERRDFAALGAIVADEGLDVTLGTAATPNLRREEVLQCARDRRERIWGQVDGEDFQSTCAGMFARLLDGDRFSVSAYVSYQPDVGGSGDDPDLRQQYQDDSIIVEFMLPMGRPCGDCSTRAVRELRLVFRPHADDWKLVAVTFRSHQDSDEG